MHVSCGIELTLKSLTPGDDSNWNLQQSSAWRPDATRVLLPLARSPGVLLDRYTFVHEPVTRPGRYTFARRMCIDGISLPGNGIPLPGNEIPRRRNPGGSPFRRGNDAEPEVTEAITYEEGLPARKRRRRESSRRESVRDAPSGEEMTPEARLRSTQLRKRALRRHRALRLRCAPVPQPYYPSTAEYAAMV